MLVSGAHTHANTNMEWSSHIPSSSDYLSWSQGPAAGDDEHTATAPVHKRPLYQSVSRALLGLQSLRQSSPPCLLALLTHAVTRCTATGRHTAKETITEQVWEQRTGYIPV